MQSAARSLIDEVETELAKASPLRRLELLRKVTDLCVVTAPRASDEAINAFDHVITWMAQDMEFRARLELSERLSKLDRAPQTILGKLAEDEAYEVAKPVLENSKAIAEEVLLRIAQRGEEKRLISIAGRATVSEQLTDVIVDKGGQTSVRRVAQNSGARFSSHGFTRLAERADADEGLQTILGKRSDLPSEVVVRLAEKAKQRATEALTQGVSPQAAAEAKNVVGEIASEIARNQIAVALEEYDEDAKRIADQLAQEGRLDDRAIAEWLRNGEVNQALTGMGVLTKLPFHGVKQAFHGGVTDALLFIVKAIPLSLGTYHLLLAAKIGHKPSDDYLSKETQSYKTLSVSTAQRIVRFMAVRGVAQNGTN